MDHYFFTPTKKANWAAGNIVGAVAEFRSLRNSGHTFRPGCYSVTLSKRHGCLKITNILLDMPPEVFARVDDIFKYSSNGHFSRLRTKIINAEILKTSLQQLGLVVRTNSNVRGYMGQQVHADIVAILNGDYDLGWSRNPDGVFEMICDLGGVSDLYNQTELINSIGRQYFVNKT